MSIIINKLGYSQVAIKSARIEMSLDNLCRSFNAVLNVYDVIKEEIPELLVAGDYIEFLLSAPRNFSSLDKNVNKFYKYRILTGFVDSIAIDYNIDVNRRTHNMIIKGRGRTQDLLDSTIRPEHIETTNSNFVSMVKNVVALLNLSSIFVENRAGEITPFTDEIQSAEVGIGAFDFLASYAQKRQLLLNENSKGDIIIQRGGNKTRKNVGLLNINEKNKLSINNNIKMGSFEQDISDRFYKYTFDSQLNPATQKISKPKEELTNQNGIIFDTLMRSGRELEINSDIDLSYEDMEKRAIWERNVRRARGFNYTCVVPEHFAQDGEAWRLNELVYVRDDFCAINGYYLVKRIVFEENIDSGSTTSITLTYPNAYSLSLEDEVGSYRTTTYLNDKVFIRDDEKYRRIVKVLRPINPFNEIKDD
jgi:prophage tail gpP-like protein